MSQDLTATYIKATKIAPIPRIYTPCYTNIKREGSLMVWWIPQIPMDSFLYPVSSVKEARAILKCLALYDLFQFEKNVKGDFANAGGLLVFEKEVNVTEWLAWTHPKTAAELNDLDEATLASYI